VLESDGDGSRERALAQKKWSLQSIEEGRDYRSIADKDSAEGKGASRLLRDRKRVEAVPGVSDAVRKKAGY